MAQQIFGYTAIVATSPGPVYGPTFSINGFTNMVWYVTATAITGSPTPVSMMEVDPYSGNPVHMANGPLAGSGATLNPQLAYEVGGYLIGLLGQQYCVVANPQNGQAITFNLAVILSD
jgi:hypothetical protein